MKKILIVGATSRMALELARMYAAEGAHMVLAGVEADEQERVAADVRVGNDGEVYTADFDVTQLQNHRDFLDQVIMQLGGLDGLVLFCGSMAGVEEAKTDPQALDWLMRVNAIGPMALAGLAAEHMQQQRTGFIIGLSSVAGDRGRQSNYPYGVAKGAFALYLQGLRNRLYKSGVRVITMKPGFVDTRMTWGMGKLPFIASAEEVARAIYHAPQGAQDIVYVKPIWALIMWVIKHIPEAIFKRMKL